MTILLANVRACWLPNAAFVVVMGGLLHTGGCLDAPYRQCTDGSLCPADKICHPTDKVCVAANQCGNGIVEADELCDGKQGQLPERDSCVTHGYHLGRLECSSACTWDDIGDCRYLFGFYQDEFATQETHDGSPDRASSPLTGIWGRGRKDIFVTDASGTVSCFDGNGWKILYKTDTVALNGIAGTATAVFAVGNEGLVLRFNGSCAKMPTATMEATPKATTLHAVWVEENAAGIDAIAVGEDGIILRRVSGVWSPESTVTQEDLLAVSGHVDDVYAVGTAGAVLTRDKENRSWSPAAKYPSGLSTWRDIWIDETNNIRFLVGDGGAIACATGAGDWVMMDSDTSVNLHGVWGQDGHVYVVGDSGTVLYYASHAHGCDAIQDWVPMPTPISVPLLDIWGSDAHTGLAVGGSTNSVVLQHDGTRIELVEHGAWNQLYGLWSVPEGDDVIAVGAEGTILRVDPEGDSGGSQEINISPLVLLNSVWGPDRNTVFAVGTRGSLVQYDDGAWKDIRADTCIAEGAWLDAVWGTSTGEVFIVGHDGGDLSGDNSSTANGVIVHRRNHSWHCLAAIDGAPIDAPLRDVWVNDDAAEAGEAFAVGNKGLILRYDRNTAMWSRVHTGLTEHEATQQFAGQQLNGVWQSRTGAVFIVGEGGLILHRDPKAGWSRMPSGTTETLLAVRGSAPDDVFAVGNNATLLHYDGTRWTPISIRSARVFEDLYAVVVRSRQEIWLLGNNSLLRFVRP